MPKKDTILNLFVFSPENLKGERISLCKVIKELNNVWEKDNIQLKLVEWMSDLNSLKFYNFDPNHDIFIGIVWKQFRTQYSNLSIEEQFNFAYDNFKRNSDNIQLTFFFNCITPKEDNFEFGLIGNFKSRLKKINIPYWEYTGVENFGPLAKTKLNEIIQEWGKSWGSISDKKDGLYNNIDFKSDIIKITELNDEELFKTSQNNFKKLVEVLDNITFSTKSLIDNMNSINNEFVHMNSTYDMKKIKYLLQLTANDMEKYVIDIEPELRIFSKTFSTGLFALVQILKNDFNRLNNDQILNEIQQLEILKNDINSSTKSIKEFKNAVSDLPIVTKDINLAKNNTLSLLDYFINEMDDTKYILTEAENELYEICLNNEND